HGRYVHEPARFSEQGVDYVPPAVPDPALRTLAIVGGAFLVGFIAYQLLRRNRTESLAVEDL
ncbi:MAG: hypothetical protein MUD08_18990, partial [Cytophagales bacterium]|nr:hypothetical protein [Cytophagales bacterium]